MMQTKKAYRVLLMSFVLVNLSSTPAVEADSRSPLLASGNESLIVFIQNEAQDYITEYAVYDPDKLCLAQVGGREAAVVKMKPGKHTFYVSSYNNHRIDVDLAPGRTYFVRLSSVEKFATRVSAVIPVQRGTESYKLLKTWLQGTRAVVADEDLCRGKPLKERANRTQRRINEANAEWNSGDKLYRFNYSLLQEDGFTPKELSWL